MQLKYKAGLVLGALLIIAIGIYGWRQGAPRRESLATLARLDNALHSGNSTELLDLIALPAAVQGRTASEQSEFLVKALNDEISPEGLAVLRKQADYGPLRKLFPAEAEAWAKQAGVDPDECVAFKLERPGLRAEVVLVPYVPQVTGHSSPTFRIVRLNNVKQMADSNLLTTEK
jgi:hypothetical protein